MVNTDAYGHHRGRGRVVKEAFTAKAPVLNQLCPKCANDCKQPPQVAVQFCKGYVAIIQRGGKKP